MPKGDADQLRADVDDGWASVANLLLEALICCPFTSTEYAVFLFIVRRTYGWAQKKDRKSGMMDAITAQEIADGTGRPRRTVETAVANLKRASVLLYTEVEAGNVMAYGPNPDVAQWGLPTPEWKAAKVQLREARESGAYTQKHVDLYAETRIAILENEYRCTQNHVEVSASKPAAPVVPGPLHPNDVHPNNNDSSPKANGASGKRSKTDRDIAFESCLQAFGLDPTVGAALDGRAWGSYAKAMNKLVEAEGIEAIQHWANEAIAAGGRSLPTGAKPQTKVPATVRKEITASEWQAAYQKARNNGKQKPGGAFIRRHDEVILYERDWTPEIRAHINALRSSGRWDEKEGMAIDDPRHPGRQPVGS